MESGDYIRVEKLQSGDEWPAWKFEVGVLLRAAEVMDVVSGILKKPERGANQSQNDHEAALLKWNKSDNKAQRIIVTALGKLPKVHVLNCETSNSMWAKLESVYEKKSKSTIHFTTQKFFYFTKDPMDDIATFISKLQAIVKQMSDLGETVSDGMVMTKILNALPDELCHFPSAWESTPENLQTIENLTSRLVMEESRVAMKHQSEANGFSEALIARKFRNKKNFKSNSKPGKCHVCKQTGHWKKECPNKEQKSTVNQKATTNSTNSRRTADACVAISSPKNFGKPTAYLTLNEAMVASNGSRSDDWFLDSGASDHMSHRKEWFADYVEFEVDLPVRIGDGSYIVAKGVGTIDIWAFDNNVWCRRHLADVLYVPEIHLNLFSQGKALDKDMTLTSDKEKCKFVRDGITILVGIRESNLFKLMFKVMAEVNNFSVSKETTIDGNSEVRRWVESASSSKHKSYTVTGGNANHKVSLAIWHARLGHQNVGYIKQFLKRQNIGFDGKGEYFCEACVYGKHHRSPFTRSDNRAEKVGELVHTDVCGPMHEKSIGGARYFLLIKDDFSNFRKVYFLKEKSEVCRQIEKYLSLVKSVNCTVTVVRSDNGREFVNINVGKLMEEHGIRHQKSVTYTPEHNGRAERDMRTIVEAARTMIHSKQLPLKLWAEAVNTAVYVMNCTGPSPVKDKTPFELFYNKKPSINHLRVFGSEVFVHIPKEKRKKWNKKAKRGIFIGYSDDTKGYRVWIEEENKIEITRDIIFNENLNGNLPLISINSGVDEAENFVVFGPQILDAEVIPSVVEINAEEIVIPAVVDIEEEEIAIPEDVLVEPVPTDDFEEFDSDLEKNDEEQSFIGHRTRHRTFLAETMAVGNCFVSIKEPKSYEMALKCDDSAEWKEAMDDEFNSLIENQTWDLVDLPKNRNVIDNKWVFKIKEKPNGEIERYRARLVVRGFTQEHGIDYSQTFSPVVSYTSIRTIMAIAAVEKLKLAQFDVQTAFLYGDLDEEIYMRQPVGYEDGTKKVCLLKKSLYGLKQASRNWNKKFTDFLKAYNLKVSTADPCVFIGNGERRLILGIFIDDGIVAASHEEDITNLMNYLTIEFKIRVLEAECFVGLEIERSQNGSIHLCQAAYTRKILEKFRMSDAKTASIPAENYSLEPSALSENYPYREAVGSLMYLAVGTRPDISFAVGRASRFLSQPKESDVVAVKRIFRYLRGTINYGIVYEQSAKFDLECFSDSDYAGCPVSRRSTSGFVFKLGSGAISWCSQLQKSVVVSTTEAEYVAGAQSVKEMIWIKRLISNLLIKCDSVFLRMDNRSAIRLVENSEPHKRTKHVDIKYHFIREKYEEGNFELTYIPTEDQIADILTKPLARVKFEKFRELMGMSQ